MAEEAPLGEDRSARAVVENFLLTVRSGRSPERADEFMDTTVAAHQVQSEESTLIRRTPDDYADHVREMLQTYGNFTFAIEELIADGDKVYARWRQEGTHVGAIDGLAPTGLPIVEVASCVYRVRDGKICEYWIQIDRAGLAAQLESGASAGPRGPV